MSVSFVSCWVASSVLHWALLMAAEVVCTRSAAIAGSAVEVAAETAESAAAVHRPAGHQETHAIDSVADGRKGVSFQPLGKCKQAAVAEWLREGRLEQEYTAVAVVVWDSPLDAVAVFVCNAAVVGEGRIVEVAEASIGLVGMHIQAAAEEEEKRRNSLSVVQDILAAVKEVDKHNTLPGVQAG